MKMKKLLSVFIAVIITLLCIVPASAAKDVCGKVKCCHEITDGKSRLVFYPKELEKSDNAYPVIIWANGTGCLPVLYVKLFGEFVKQGFVVVASSDVMPADGKEQIACADYIIEKAKDGQSIFSGRIDCGKIIAMGHSQGGRSTVNAVSADKRFCCAVSIAGSNYTYEAEKNSAPTLFIAGTADNIVDSEKWIKPAYNSAKGSAAYASLKNAGHTACCLFPDEYVKYSVKWIKAWAYGDKEALNAFLPGGELSKDSKWQDFECKNINGVTSENYPIDPMFSSPIARIAEFFSRLFEKLSRVF